jgi:hypothetical protein
VTDVQSALDVLCSKIVDKEEPKALTLTSILFLDAKGQATHDLVFGGELLLNALEVRYNAFSGGIAFSFDGGMPAIKIKDFDPIVEIELDLPFPTTDSDRLYWLQVSGQVNSFVGFQRMRLDGTVEVTPKGPVGKPALIWRPTRDAMMFLESTPRHLWGQRILATSQLEKLGWSSKTPYQRIVCRIRLRSALIFVKGEPKRLYLNAEHLGVVGDVTNRELHLGERDPQRAGDLDIYVFLAGENVKIVPIKLPPVTPVKGIPIPRRDRPGRVAENDLAPFHPTPQEIVDQVLELAQLKKGERLFDLGSGDGRVVVTAARKFGAVATGIEADKRLAQQTAKAIKKLKLEKKARSVHGDVVKQDVSSADVVTVYLTPSGNEAIRPMLEKQLKRGARVVSHDYEIPGWTPEKTERIDDADGRTHTLYLYMR